MNGGPRPTDTERGDNQVMGRQLRFFLLPSEANKLVDELRSRFEAKLLVDYSPERDLVEVERPFQVAESGTMEPVSLLSRYYLAPSINRIPRGLSFRLVRLTERPVDFSELVVSAAAGRLSETIVMGHGGGTASWATNWWSTCFCPPFRNAAA
jgi:hypothetical protein